MAMQKMTWDLAYFDQFTWPSYRFAFEQNELYEDIPD